MFNRTITFHPAFDRRHSDPTQDQGINSVELRFVLRGELGAVEFMLFTNWFLPHVRAQLGGEFCKPGPCELVFHGRRPEDGDYAGACLYLDSQICYVSRQFTAADPILGRLLEEGDQGVWAALEAHYRERFR